jgi:hypothetical protein
MFTRLLSGSSGSQVKRRIVALADPRLDFVASA